MIEFEEAINKILKHTHCLSSEFVKLNDSLGYVLAENVVAREPIPRFDSSAVDGYAVCIEDLKNASNKTPVELPIIGEVKAGDTIIPILRKNYAIKIFTGAVVPKNTTAVVMQENTKTEKKNVLIFRKPEKGENIRRAGEEFKKDAVVLAKGELITPAVVGLLASLGYAKIRVFRKPKVALIVTGNELQLPGRSLRVGKIYDSNSFGLAVALESRRIYPIFVRLVRDDKQSIRKAISKAVKLSDVIISVGGVSVGEYDFVKEVLINLGVKEIYWKVAIKPGKPNFFGVLGKKLVFGLPGNPVAAMLSFYKLVIPALNKLMGMSNSSILELRAVLTQGIKKKAGRLEFVRGILTTDKDDKLFVTPAKGQDSHMLGGLAKANCLIHFPKEETIIPKGSMATVELLRW
jgi:molybdopterin molybdotransferase